MSICLDSFFDFGVQEINSLFSQKMNEMCKFFSNTLISVSVSNHRVWSCIFEWIDVISFWTDLLQLRYFPKNWKKCILDMLIRMQSNCRDVLLPSLACDGMTSLFSLLLLFNFCTTHAVDLISFADFISYSIFTVNCSLLRFRIQNAEYLFPSLSVRAVVTSGMHTDSWSIKRDRPIQVSHPSHELLGLYFHVTQSTAAYFKTPLDRFEEILFFHNSAFIFCVMAHKSFTFYSNLVYYHCNRKRYLIDLAFARSILIRWIGELDELAIKAGKHLAIGSNPQLFDLFEVFRQNALFLWNSLKRMLFFACGFKAVVCIYFSICFLLHTSSQSSCLLWLEKSCTKKVKLEEYQWLLPKFDYMHSDTVAYAEFSAFFPSQHPSTEFIDSAFVQLSRLECFKLQPVHSFSIFSEIEAASAFAADFIESNVDINQLSDFLTAFFPLERSATILSLRSDLIEVDFPVSSSEEVEQRNRFKLAISQIQKKYQGVD